MGYTRDEKRLVSRGGTIDSDTDDKPDCTHRMSHSGLAQSATDALVGHLFVPIDAVGIHAEQHFHRVTSTAGNRGRGNASVEPQRDRRMPQVIGTASQR